MIWRVIKTVLLLPIAALVVTTGFLLVSVAVMLICVATIFNLPYNIWKQVK